MQSIELIKRLLGEALGLGVRAEALTADTPLLGHLPELDSMTVVSIISLLEERLGIVISDEEITADAFRTVGSLAKLADTKMLA